MRAFLKQLRFSASHLFIFSPLLLLFKTLEPLSPMTGFFPLRLPFCWLTERPLIFYYKLTNSRRQSSLQSKLKFYEEIAFVRIRQNFLQICEYAVFWIWKSSRFEKDKMWLDSEQVCSKLRFEHTMVLLCWNHCNSLHISNAGSHGPISSCDSTWEQRSLCGQTAAAKHLILF